MGAPENEHIYGIQIRESANDGSDFTNADADYRRLFLGEDGQLHVKDSAGTVTDIGSGSGNVATDPIWDAAGDLAVGTGANTAARLAIGNAGGAVRRINGAVAWDAGTAFPSAASGDRFWRSDLGMDFFYNGTRWLSAQLFTTQIRWTQTSAALAMSATVGAGQFQAPVPFAQGGSDIWLVEHITRFHVAGGTALSGSHKWVGTLFKSDSAASDTSITTINIDSGSSSVFRSIETAIGALLGNGTTYYRLTTGWTKTGTPGNLIALEEITYRIVAT